MNSNRKKCGDFAGTLMEGIAKQLRSISPVYFDRGSGQGMDAPCFIVAPDGLEEQRFAMGRLRRDYGFVVTYRHAPKASVADAFPSRRASPDGDAKEDDPVYHALRVMGERLLCELALIQTPGGASRGSGLRYALKDGALKFSVTYPVFLRESKSCPKMGQLNYTLPVSGGEGL